MKTSDLQKAYDTLPTHFFLHIKSTLGHGNYLLVDKLTGMTCRVSGASPNFEVGQEIELQKGYAGLGGLCANFFAKLLGNNNPFSRFRIMNLASQNISQVELTPVENPIDFAQACWDARKEFSVYRQN